MNNLINIYNKPLADRIRPVRLSEYYGQPIAKKAISELISGTSLSSIIFWGPPGTGKTTLARIVGKVTKANFISLSAVNATLKEVRKEIKLAKDQQTFNGQKTILFIDELHRFNKAQQDTFLPFVEDGTITLIGATTENPSFEVIAPLLSRTQVIVLKPLNKKELLKILIRAKKDKKKGLGKYYCKIKVKTLKYIASQSGGDARTALNILEKAVLRYREQDRVSLKTVKSLISQTVLYDKKGEEHFNTISAFIKSLRGSNPDAALHYLARMIKAGEDPKFIARRLVILASEDVGNADPVALLVATAAFQAVEKVGLPEAGINLAQATTYLASAPKSNASYLGYMQALKDINNKKLSPIPHQLRNAITDLMKDLEYGKNYQYAHDYDDQKAPDMEYLPKELKNRKYYQPKEVGYEKKIKKRLEL